MKQMEEPRDLLVFYISLNLCLICQYRLAVWSLTLPHVRPHDRSAGSKFGIYNPYKMRIFFCSTRPCLPHRCTGKPSLLAWNHLVDQLLLKKLHSFGILDLTHSSHSRPMSKEGRLGSINLTHQLSFHSLICFATVLEMGSGWLMPRGFFWLPELTSPQSTSLNLKY